MTLNLIMIALVFLLFILFMTCLHLGWFKSLRINRVETIGKNKVEYDMSPVKKGEFDDIDEYIKNYSKPKDEFSDIDQYIKTYDKERDICRC